FGADAGLVAEADEQLLELIADQNGPGSGGADGLAQVGSFGGAERGAQVGQRLIEGADVDRSQAAGHQLGEDSGKEKRRLAQTRPAVEDQRAGAQDAGHHVTDLAVAAGEKVFVVLAVVVEKFERARRLERCERLDSGAIGHGWPSRAAASRASRSASVSASIHSNPSKRSQKASSTASRWRQAKNAVPRFLDISGPRRRPASRRTMGSRGETPRKRRVRPIFFFPCARWTIAGGSVASRS